MDMWNQRKLIKYLNTYLYDVAGKDNQSVLYQGIHDGVKLHHFEVWLDVSTTFRISWWFQLLGKLEYWSHTSFMPMYKDMALKRLHYIDEEIKAAQNNEFIQIKGGRISRTPEGSALATDWFLFFDKVLERYGHVGSFVFGAGGAAAVWLAKYLFFTSPPVS